ncbi:unnamed protein product [Brassica oleracea]
MNDKLTISENCGLGMPSRVLYQAMVVDPELYSELAGESWRSGLPKRHQMKSLPNVYQVRAIFTWAKHGLL